MIDDSMSECLKFTCLNQNNGLCKYSQELCTGKACAGFYGKCDICRTTMCVFKETFLKEQSDYISILKYRQQRKYKKNLNRVYAVKVGRKVGIYDTWLECLAQINGYQGAVYQVFTKKEDAEKFLGRSEQVPKPTQNAQRAETAVAYVDGSYNAQTKVYGYGCVINDGKNHNIFGNGTDPAMAAMRNVAGEIEGAMAAIRYAQEHNIKQLTIYYDYTGIEAWATGTWRANKKETQAYRDFCQKCPVKLKFQKVKGHAGVLGNEQADRLAKEAVGITDKYSSQKMYHGARRG